MRMSPPYPEAPALLLSFRRVEEMMTARVVQTKLDENATRCGCCGTELEGIEIENKLCSRCDAEMDAIMVNLLDVDNLLSNVRLSMLEEDEIAS